jgi:ferredoxin-NADP reductase
MTAGSGPVRLRVASAWRAADQVRCFLLTDPDGGDLPDWAPGAHVDLFLPGGRIRQYSLCGDPADRRTWRVAVLLEDDSRGGSRYLHEAAGEGTELTASLPRNNFPLVDAARYVFIAGGIGITPLLPMIAAATAAGADWRLHYGARSLDRMAFTAELDRHGDRYARYPQDTHGLMPLAEILGAAADGAAVYCCGPEPLLAAVEGQHRGRRAGTLHLERFHPVALAPGAVDGEFDVVIDSSGQVVRVRAGQSVLTALERAGVDVPSSCQEGTCATCETPVLEGEVEHRDSVLTQEERASGRTMMLCVSRARSPRLVLDLLSASQQPVHPHPFGFRGSAIRRRQWKADDRGTPSCSARVWLVSWPPGCWPSTSPRSPCSNETPLTGPHHAGACPRGATCTASWRAAGRSSRNCSRESPPRPSAAARRRPRCSSGRAGTSAGCAPPRPRPA